MIPFVVFYKAWRKRGHTNPHRFWTVSCNRPARAVLGDMTSSRGHQDDDPLCHLLRGMEKMRPHQPTSMSLTSYEIHIHELSRLCHITAVWVSSQEVTHHQDGPCYWSCIGEGSATSVFHPRFIEQNAPTRVLTHRSALCQAS
jgi:hypothetical protein